MLTVGFYGVRGSTPCSSEANRRFGGNTSCVALEVPGEDPLVFDLGTGLRFWGHTQPDDGTFHGAALVSHLHWDHVQGLPFFVPINRPGATLDVYGPHQEGSPSVEDAFHEFMRPPYFPVQLDGLAGEVRFHDLGVDDVAIGTAKVRARPVPHVGLTSGYRVEWGGASVAYVSDHQQPLDGSLRVPDDVLELCDGADLVIHDAQYTREEFCQKPHWGHCTVEYAVHVAREAGARRLALFHHDPDHHDAVLDVISRNASDAGERVGLEVLTAHEGLTVAFDG
ncbi:MAG: MBL fold metallo-hydrolase [Acidimicrobiales bacterium]|nr:MBL fold metallo-hydrolase [Acidimicrobiales bacterium]